MSMTIRQTRQEIQTQIDSILATADSLVASTEGTHGGPQHFYVWRPIQGEDYATTRFSGANHVTCSMAKAEAGEGTLRYHQNACTHIATLRQQLAKLKREMKSAD